MTWFKVDDGLAFHAKVVQVGNAAMGLWVRAGSWSAQQLTDGFVPDHIVTTLGTRGQAAALAEVGLWLREDSGYRFHGWLDYQPTREQVEKERAEARERMRKAREAKRSSRDVRANTDRTSGDVRSTRPDPSRPDLPTTQERGGSHLSRAPHERPPFFDDRCARHITFAEPPPCGACADVRKANRAKVEQLPDYRLRVVPPLCGQCDERWVETATGVEQCPRCHPSAVAS